MRRALLTYHVSCTGGGGGSPEMLLLTQQLVASMTKGERFPAQAAL